MAIRIQFRRGTAAEWATANPILAAGELGYESDTGQFKIGNSTDHWNSLSYGAVSQTYVEDAIANVVGLAPSTLDTLNELANAIGNDADFLSVLHTDITNAQADAEAYADDAVNTHSNDITNVHGISNTAALETSAGAQSKADAAQANAKSYTDSTVASLIDSAPSALNTLNELAAALGNNPNLATDITTSLGSKLSFVVDTSTNFVAANALTIANTVYIESNVPGYVRIGDGVHHYNDLKFIAQDFVTDSVVAHNTTTLDIHGISNTANLAYLSDVSAVQNTINDHLSDTVGVHGIENTANLVYTSDLGTHTSKTTSVHGIANTADLVVTADLAAYAPLNGATLANATVTGTATLPSDTQIGSVSATEISYLNGITSNIQDQIDGKADADNLVVSVSATLPTNTSIGSVSSVELGYLSNVTADIQTQLDSHYVSPTFTGNVVLPSTTTIGNISATELGYIDGLTSSAQTQLDNLSTAVTARLTIANAVLNYAPLEGGTLDNATFTGTTTLPSTTSIGNVSATELSQLDGVTSGIQAQIDAKAPTANPSFTGTVSGVTKAMVGLGNVNNTSDANKPVSTATQSALDLKQDKVSGVSDTEIGYLDGVTSSIQTQLDSKAGSMHELDDVASYNGSLLNGGELLTWNASNASWEPAAIDLTGKQDVVSGVSSTEIGYLDGVTSAIQTQLNAKLASSTAASTYAPIASPTFTGTVAGISKSMVGLGNVDNTSDANKPISTATQTALDLKAPIANATFTGTTTVNDLEIGGTLHFVGTATQIDQTNLSVTDSLIYLADAQYDTDVLDIGIYGAYGDSNPGHFHTGLVRDASDGKWKLISGGAEPTNNIVDFTSVTYDTLKIGSLEATSATIGNVSNTELQYLDGVTSAIQTQINAKAPSESPTLANVTVTGSLSLPSGSVTSTMIADGTIANGDISGTAAIAYSKLNVANSISNSDINTSAAIAATKIAGTAVTQADTGTVTSTMIADGTIVNGDISASAAIAVSKLAASTISGVTLGSNLNALTIGTGLSGSSYNGSGAVTVAIDSSVATLTGTQSLTNKTITFAAGGATFSDGTTQTTAGVPSLTTIKTALAASTSTSALASALTYRDALVPITNAISFTVDSDGTNGVTFPVGTSIDFYQSSGTGAQFVQGSGVTLQYTPGLKFRALYSSATITKVASNTWLVYGDLMA